MLLTFIKYVLFGLLVQTFCIKVCSGPYVRTVRIVLGRIVLGRTLSDDFDLDLELES